jgi:hypothetical protein
MYSLFLLTGLLSASAIGTLTKLVFDEWQLKQHERRRMRKRRR